jgi:hypothetical protein
VTDVGAGDGRTLRRVAPSCWWRLDRAAGALLGLALLGMVAGPGSSEVMAGPPVVPSELLSRAEARGTVRVIVHLEIPPGTATESVKQDVLAVIAPTPHQVTRALPGLPLLALEASSETLLALARSAGVQRVEEDSLSRLPE